MPDPSVAQNVCPPKRRCVGLLGLLFGHRYYVKHYWGKQLSDYCTRCGAGHA